MIDEKNDYLEKDPEIKGQKFVLMSFLTSDKSDVRGIKIRGIFDNENDAKDYAKKLNKLDLYSNIYIGDVGVWLPFCDDITKSMTNEYMQDELNEIMKQSINTKKSVDLEFEKRKQDMMANNSEKQEELNVETKFDSKLKEFEKKMFE
jgi:hypothetical protein